MKVSSYRFKAIAIDLFFQTNFTCLIVEKRSICSSLEYLVIEIDLNTTQGIEEYFKKNTDTNVTQ